MPLLTELRIISAADHNDVSPTGFWSCFRNLSRPCFIVSRTTAGCEQAVNNLLLKPLDSVRELLVVWSLIVTKRSRHYL